MRCVPHKLEFTTAVCIVCVAWLGARCTRMLRLVVWHIVVGTRECGERRECPTLAWLYVGRRRLNSEQHFSAVSRAVCNSVVFQRWSSTCVGRPTISDGMLGSAAVTSDMLSLNVGDRSRQNDDDNLFDEHARVRQPRNPTDAPREPLDAAPLPRMVMILRRSTAQI